MSLSNIRGLLFAAACGTAVACSTDRATGPETDDLARRVAELGFSTKGMEDNGDYVVVEGDIRLNKAALLNAPRSTPPSAKRVPGPPAFQYYTNALVSQTYVTQIVVDLTNIQGVSDWADAARSAIADYNAAGSAVHMSEGSPGDITFSSVTSFPNPYGIAQASFPYQGSPAGKPGPTITVAQNYNDAYALGQKEKVLVHEFGHTLGLRHDNAAVTEGSAGIGANRVGGTPTSDPNSVMVTPYDGSYWSGFDQYDVVALKSLYNPMSVTLSGATSIPTQHWCHWSATVTGGVPPYTYYWGVVNNSNMSPQNGTQQSFFAFTGYYFNNPFIIYVTVTDASGWGGGQAVNVSYTSGSYDHTYCP